MAWVAKSTGGYSRNSQEALNNCTEIKNFLVKYGWTINAICGLIGNIEAESSYNPLIWQDNDIGVPNIATNGYGLVQFTPAKNYILSEYAQKLPDYAPQFYSNNGVLISGNARDGIAQLEYIDIQPGYYPTAEYPETYDEYRKSTSGAKYLARAWMYNYERPGDYETSIGQRQEAASYWYEYFTGEMPPETGSMGGWVPKPKEKGMPLFMMLFFK